MCFPELTGARQVVSTATFQSLPNKQQILQELLLHANQIIFFNSILCQQNFLERWSWLAWLSFSCILCPVFLFCWVGSFCKKNGHMLPTGQRYVPPIVIKESQSCPTVVPVLVQSCPKIALKFPKVVSKLSRNCLKIVPQLSLSYPKWYPKVFHVVPIWVAKWCPLGFHVATRWVEWVNMILLMWLE